MDPFQKWCSDLAARGEAALKPPVAAVKPPVAVLLARGGSMWPSVRDGAALVVRAGGIADLGPGDVAVLRVGENLVCHRVLAVGPGRVTVKGDSMMRVESYAVPRQAEVLGRVANKSRALGLAWSIFSWPAAAARRIFA